MNENSKIEHETSVKHQRPYFLEMDWDSVSKKEWWQAFEQWKLTGCPLTSHQAIDQWNKIQEKSKQGFRSRNRARIALRQWGYWRVYSEWGLNGQDLELKKSTASPQSMVHSSLIQRVPVRRKGQTKGN